MTLHDDSNLQVLERELRALAAPHEGDERVRLAIRRELATQLRPQPRRLRRRLALSSLGAAAAAAAIMLVALAASTGSGGPTSADAAIVHHTIRAITPPPDAILHVKVVGVQNGAAVMGETWQETSPPYASRGMKGAAGHAGEFIDDGTNSYFYDPSTNTYQEQRDSSPPTFTDPVSQVRQALISGQAHDIGTAVIDGAALIKIDLKGGMVGYFDMHSYQPRYLDDPQRDGASVRLRVIAYAYLPATPAQLALFRPPAGARPDAGPTTAATK